MANGIRRGDPHGFNKVRSSVKVSEFDKHLKIARGHIDRNVVEITMKTIVRKTLMIKIIQNSLTIDATYENDLVLRQETQKGLHVLEADMITIKRSIDFISLDQRMHFYQTCSIALVSVISRYHLNGSHLFQDSLSIYSNPFTLARSIFLSIDLSINLSVARTTMDVVLAIFLSPS